RSIVAGIWEGIREADLVVADATGRNSNVFYELGITHPLGKPTVLIAQTTSDVPFDLIHFRVLTYKADPQSLFGLRNDLTDAIRRTLVTASERGRRQLAPEGADLASIREAIESAL